MIIVTTPKSQFIMYLDAYSLQLVTLVTEQTKLHIHKLKVTMDCELNNIT